MTELDRQIFIKVISDKMKLIRTEQGYTQDKMAEVLGVSKKTLVQIEKGRTTANWTTVAACCALFNQSELLISTLGDNPVEFVQMVAHQSDRTVKDKTLGGKIWWKEVSRKGSFRLQQNLISHHYRILDQEDYRWYSTFDEKEAIHRLTDLAGRDKRI